ncbi:hypothetical protein B7R54_19420 [Subtercola boreus]|uniref:PDZ domain-containing protein n=1 Tax=Subtercola boreus TaxID=120213 RepID=A0A3E0V9R7_9MICO|nr:trypsin-like peptidase domain-containing protein [Subtercola boreus]RFA06536.1 hypothetical protein B7R54_19420 [Subtercola boreus]TQL46835.1 putative serine protease PepD [Subtercola boreus]
MDTPPSEQPVFGPQLRPEASPVSSPPLMESRVAQANSPQRRLTLLGCLALGAVLAGGGAAGLTVSALGPATGTQTIANPQTITISGSGTANAIAAIAAKAMPSVMTISVTDGAGTSGTGSGVVLSPAGLVLTNTHVVTLDGATGTPVVSAIAANGKKYSAEIVGTDPVADLAVIRLAGASGLTPLAFGDSSTLQVGEPATAIGAPLGLSGTVTTGIVSALDRSITVPSSAAPKPGIAAAQGMSATSVLAVIQTDAAINPGNSGGPLLNAAGKLIGINVAIASAGASSSPTGSAGNIGVGFSIPANEARRVANEIIASGSATHGLLGVSVGTTPPTASSSAAGAPLAAIAAGGPAEMAGLVVGDIVTAVGSTKVASASDLTAEIRALPAGATVAVTYVRAAATAQTTVTLAAFAG